MIKMENREPKKSLGQNFLTSEAAVYKIVQAAKILPGETVLEVGPGRGVLTTALLKAQAKVVAIEKDETLAAELLAKFATEIKDKRLKILTGDILEIEQKNIDLTEKYKIVANIPYYITGQFLRKFLSSDGQPTAMVLLLQKEVVDRIIAQNNKESLASMSVKVYGEPKKITTVNRGSFFPAPNVDSAVIAIENISKKFFDTVSEENFWNVLRAGFAHKRKVLVSNLSGIKDKEKILEIFAELKIDPKTRAEDLTKEQWKMIAKKIAEN